MLSPPTRISVRVTSRSLPMLVGISHMPAAARGLAPASGVSVIESVSMCLTVSGSMITSMLDGGAPSVRSIGLARMARVVHVLLQCHHLRCLLQVVVLPVRDHHHVVGEGRCQDQQSPVQRVFESSG